MVWSYGIDISNHQGVIDWDVLNQDPSVEFVYMLVSDGQYRGRPPGAQLSIAESYLINTKRCRKPCGPYHFARPHDTDPYRMAEQVVNDAGPMAMPHCLDLEDYAELKSMSLQDCVDWSAVWLTQVHRFSGKRPIFYNSAFFKGPGIARYFPNHFWWLPSYTGNSRLNPDPLTLKSPALNGNREPDMWQYTDHGRKSGVAGNLDLNLVLTDKLRTLIHLEGEDMPTLAEIADLVRTVAGSAIYHVNPHQSPRMQFLSDKGILFPPLTSDTVPDLAFQVFPDYTMVQRTGQEIARLNFIGVPDHGFRDDSWWDLLRLTSRDAA